jgi:hypothetical protein
MGNRARILLTGACAVAVLGTGNAGAALQNQLNVDIIQKSQGKPATVKVYASNKDTNPDGSLRNIPERISKVVVKSKSAKWNPRAVKKCTSPVPSKEVGGTIVPACPSSTQVGTGSGVILAGKAGRQAPPRGSAYYAEGTIKIFHYQTQPGDKVTLLVETISDQPVPDAHLYVLAHVDSRGTLTANIPNVGDIPLNLAQFYPERDLCVIEFSATLNPRRTKFFMLKKGNLNMELSVKRE